MIFHENCLPVEDSHEICLIHYFRKSRKIRNCRLLQITGGALKANLHSGCFTFRSGFVVRTITRIINSARGNTISATSLN